MFKLKLFGTALSVLCVLSVLNRARIVKCSLWRHSSRAQFRSNIKNSSLKHPPKSGHLKVRMCNDEPSPLRTPRDYYLDTASTITMTQYELPNQNWNHNHHQGSNHNQIILHNTPQNTNYHRFAGRQHSATNAHQNYHNNHNQQQQQQQWPPAVKQNMNFDDNANYELIQNFNNIDFFKNDQFYKQNPQANTNQNHRANYQKPTQQKHSKPQPQQQQKQQQKPQNYESNDHNNQNNNNNNKHNRRNQNHKNRQNRARISVAAKHPTQYSHDYVPFEPMPEPSPEPQIIEVTGDVVPIIVNFKSLSSPVELRQHHQMSKVTEPEETKSEDEPQILKHQVLKPIIQIVKEIITPYRKVIQEVRPVEEVIHTVISRKKKKPEKSKPNFEFHVSDFGKYVADNNRHTKDTEDIPEVIYREMKANTNSDIKLHQYDFAQTYDDSDNKLNGHHYNGQNNKSLEKNLESQGGIVTYVTTNDSIDTTSDDKVEQITEGSHDGVNNQIGSTVKDNNNHITSTETVHSSPLTELNSIHGANHLPTESSVAQLTSTIAEDS